MKRLPFIRDNLIDFVKQTVGKQDLSIGEIGVYRGKYTEVYINRATTSRVYLIDIWETSNHDGYISGMGPGDIENGYKEVQEIYGVLPNVTLCKGFSTEWSQKFNDEFFDWVYLDADHSYQSVLNDIKHWYPKVKKGGIISGHDFLPNPNHDISYFGVDKAVCEFFNPNDIFLTNEEYYKSWVYIKN